MSGQVSTVRFPSPISNPLCAVTRSSPRKMVAKPMNKLISSIYSMVQLPRLNRYKTKDRQTPLPAPISHAHLHNPSKEDIGLARQPRFRTSQDTQGADGKGYVGIGLDKSAMCEQGMEWGRKDGDGECGVENILCRWRR
jgi:hypothetical protein